MSPTWHGDPPPPQVPPAGLGAWLRVVFKGTALVALVFGGLFLLLFIRLLERPLFGPHRPVTPHITVFVCRWALRIIGLQYRCDGKPSAKAGAIVANHASWLDIFVLNAAGPVYFVSKSEVAGWPGIGWLAKATGTVFIQRDRSQAAAQAALFSERLQQGHRLLFFPEGTSSDGQRVLPFRSTLFAAFFGEELNDEIAIQPVTIVYRAPKGADARFYAWWGDMDFGPHLLSVLAAPRQGQVAVSYHIPVPVSDYGNRKDLSNAVEKAVLHGFGSPVPEAYQSNGRPGA